MGFFKAFIRVVKSLAVIEDKYGWTNPFDSVTIIREPLIEAKDKNEVKEILLSKYPQFFPKDKVYQRETKDEAQFFYVVIFPLYEYEKILIEEGEWKCSQCGQVHENKYVSKPRIDERLLGSDVMFCSSDDDVCYENFKKEKWNNVEFPDDEYYITKESPIYIYKCTEKATDKCYVGKTRNAPFFRWWNHLTKSYSPFGLYLRETKLSDWTFEVLEELPSNIEDSQVNKVESEYMLKFNSIKNGFNSVISNKEVLNNNINQIDIFVLIENR
ncbi:GIY-YIG nuclease family protein [Tenacibaculum caenipelagi]|uniref:GIY-YIG domain-containing protein n=1 Tax=Tenacibaculum caenipelagi TaxID=1325435 RepID=A0A4R6TE53_9FLAO|nr:hypothetical protein [Tenacibaculum caenipelagi]TDQ27653.1 hypothetical protein DFQ07_1504 [Tenacibaculum caenipelagi]